MLFTPLTTHSASLVLPVRAQSNPKKVTCPSCCSPGLLLRCNSVAEISSSFCISPPRLEHRCHLPSGSIASSWHRSDDSLYRLNHHRSLWAVLVRVPLCLQATTTHSDRRLCGSRLSAQSGSPTPASCSAVVSISIHPDPLLYTPSHSYLNLIPPRAIIISACISRRRYALWLHIDLSC